MKTTFLFFAMPVALLQSQTAPPPAPKFEVVSIKPCKLGVAKGGDSSPGRLSIGCALLADVDHTGMIQRAYVRYAGGNLNPTAMLPIEGGPEWIHSETFEIDAKADGHPTQLMMEGPMMQAVLEERFKLKVHRETRQGAVYELVLGKGSPRLKPFQEGTCKPVMPGRPLPTLLSGERYCRRMVSPRSLDIEGGTLGEAAGLLGMVLERPVIDKTGLTNPFEIHLKFSPEDSPAADLPGIFEAVQEQLGLKLVSAKGPTEVLVIDHIERPSGN